MKSNVRSDCVMFVFALFLYSTWFLFFWNFVNVVYEFCSM